MNTRPSPHGAFALRCSGDLLIIRAEGAFNGEGAVAMNEALESFWSQHGLSGFWGILIDLRAWEGSTAEGYTAAAAARQWAVSHGCHAAAWLFANTFIRQMVMKRMAGIASPYPVNAFDELAAANAWLGSLGLGPAEDV